jgi:eukaryotic-like serine/threonine-protein kinase
VRGLLQRTQGDLAGSIATYQAAIQERTAVSGLAHRETANLYNSLAITLTAGQRLDEALAAHRQALEIYRQIGRGEDLEAWILLGNIGTLAFRVGRLREAEETLALAFRQQREMAGDSAAVAAAMGLYGAVLTQQGRTSEALAVSREALGLAERFTGPGSPLAVQDRHFHTEALAAAGDLAAARALLAANLATARGQFGPDHILTLRLRLADAKLDLASGQPSEAQAQVAALLPALRQLGGQAGTWVAHALVVAGEAQLALGRPTEAAAAFREAVTLREERLWSGSWELAEARARLGEALLAEGDPAATALLESAELALRAELGPEHPQTMRAGSWLAVARGGG